MGKVSTETQCVTYRKLSYELLRSRLGVVLNRMIHQTLPSNAPLYHRDSEVAVVLIGQLGIVQATLQAKVYSLLGEQRSDKLHIEAVLKLAIRV